MAQHSGRLGLVSARHRPRRTAERQNQRVCRVYQDCDSRPRRPGYRLLPHQALHQAQ